MPNGDFAPTYSTNNIWRDDDMERCLTNDLEDIEADIATLETSKANTSHTHTGYASASDVTQLQSLVGDTSVSSQISAAMQNIDVDLTGYATETYVNTQVSALVDSAPGTLNTLNELAAALGDDANFSTTIATQLGNKVDKVSGKDLSTNDYTTAEKTKLAGIAAEANKTVVDSALSSTSTNPVQNKIINAALNNKRIFKNIASIGITTFPTTMKLIAEAMPDDSMLILDTRRINGADTANSTETISDWNNTTNGVALIFRGISEARMAMLIIYGTSQCTDSNIIYGSYAYTTNKVNWNNLKSNLDDKVDKVKHLSGVDLNTVTESGLYYVSSGTTALHFPTGSNGHMLVMSDGTRVRQVFFRVGTVDTNSFQWYSRHLGSDLTVGDNGWSKWWLLSGSESVWSGTAKLNAEINLGSRYGCQAWVIAGQVTNTDTYSTIYVPRQFLTTNQTKYKLQIADETGYVSFYFYYKESDNNVYAKIIWVSDTNNSALRFAYRVS